MNWSNEPAFGCTQYSRSVSDKAIIIGHDWGGAIAWIFAIGLPGLTECLIILNCPHPTGITRELAHNPQQQEQGAYVLDFQSQRTLC